VLADVAVAGEAVDAAGVAEHDGLPGAGDVVDERGRQPLGGLNRLAQVELDEVRVVGDRRLDEQPAVALEDQRAALGACVGAEKWFTEGFTEFYTWRLLLRAGLYTLEEFIDDWNAALLEYDTSPVRGEPNARIVEDYWNDKAVGRLPYRRGPLLAAIWDQRLRAATGGARDLDDVVLAMRAQAREGNQLARDAASSFAPTYHALGGPDLGPDLAKYVEQGAAIDLPADVFGPCIEVTRKPRRSFDRGWDADATTKAGNVITGLRKDSPAHRAGLRDGMKIVERVAGEPGDSTVEYVLKVLDGERERKIRFLPGGDQELVVQRLVLVKKLSTAQREACTRTLAGL
jgi:predicted metalloprotease with PDZ domain